MGAYKRSSTWSKEGDLERDAAVRAQWRKLSHDPATLTRACAPAMQQAASELTKALCDFVELGLDDLDACAGANAALGASLARKGVAASDFDRFLERVLAEAEATLSQPRGSSLLVMVRSTLSRLRGLSLQALDTLSWQCGQSPQLLGTMSWLRRLSLQALSTLSRQSGQSPMLLGTLHSLLISQFPSQ